MRLFDQIVDNGIIAVIRGADPSKIVAIAKALKEGGVKNIEITVETPKVLSLIEQTVDALGDEVIIGAGTVLDPETARAAIMAGAKFIFSPTVNPETIKMTKRYGVISMPGAFTPTEILTAYEHGADLVKVFPADTVGPSYLKAVHGPLPHIPLVPTGGIGLDNIGDYIKAGAVAVGLGGSLVNTKNDLNIPQITETARKFVEALNLARK